MSVAMWLLLLALQSQQLYCSPEQVCVYWPMNRQTLDLNPFRPLSGRPNCKTRPAADGCNIETICDDGTAMITAMACVPGRPIMFHDLGQ